ncbi:MAG: sensor histidine kinase [Oligoflexus sp.]
MILDRIPVRIRLSLGHAIWMAIIFIAIGIGVYRVVEDSVLQSLDATLLTSAKTIRDTQYSRDRRLSAMNNSRYWESLLDEFFGEQRTSIRAHAQLVDMSGNIQAKTGDFRIRLPVTPRAVARAEQGLETYENFQLQTGLTLRQLTLPVMQRGRFTGELVQVGASMTGAAHTLQSVKRMLWLTLTIGLVMAVFFGYLLTRWSFRPVAKITNAVANLGVSDDFDKRLKLPPANDELRRLVQTFNEMIERIEDAFFRLRRFTGDVSHELRTPLAVLRGEAELALRRERSPEEYKKSLQAIVHETSQMSHIVEDLLLLARAQGKSIAIKWEEIDLQRFLDDLMASVRVNYETKGVKLTLTNEGQPTLRVSANYLLLALKNILLNACKHSAAQGQVDLIVKSTFGETRFIVKDYGEGIPKGSLPYIFDTFYRADTARNRASGGAGIGLSLAKALVEMHGGNLLVESEEGHGACFTATIPHSLDQANVITPPKRRSNSVEMVSARETANGAC